MYLTPLSSILYTNILPKYGISKVHFRSDGAGCFNGNVVKGSFGNWHVKKNGGVTEMSYKNNVPGHGKGPMDGQFGVYGQDLNRRVDEGEEFETGEALYDLSVKYPLNFTEYHFLSLQRDKMACWGVSKSITDMKLGRSFYLLKRDNDGTIKGYCHSRHGEGKQLNFQEDSNTKGMCTYLNVFSFFHKSNMIFFHKQDDDNKWNEER